MVYLNLEVFVLQQIVKKCRFSRKVQILEILQCSHAVNFDWEARHTKLIVYCFSQETKRKNSVRAALQLLLMLSYSTFKIIIFGISKKSADFRKSADLKKCRFREKKVQIMLRSEPHIFMDGIAARMTMLESEPKYLTSKQYHSALTFPDVQTSLS